MTNIVKLTSSNVYQKVEQKGLLRGVALDVFKIVCDNPGLTIGEISLKYQKLNPVKARARNELAKRVSELYQYGALVPYETVQCSVTGRQAARWKPTNQEPNRANLAAFKAKKRAAALTKAAVKVPETFPGLLAAGRHVDVAAPVVQVAAPVLIAPYQHVQVFVGLASRCRLILRFRRVLTRSYVARVESLLKACEWAVN